MLIRKARKEDATFLAETVMQAIGDDLCRGLAGGSDCFDNVERLFRELAAVEASQYSYTNALVAEDNDRSPAGAIIAYDGARLRSLRTSFIEKANELLGWNITESEAENWEDEAGPDEVYIDSLYVKKEYRNRGIATALIESVAEQFRDAGKPLGILVEPENVAARRLYENLGFRFNGINRFCGTPMHHLLKPGTFQT